MKNTALLAGEAVADVEIVTEALKTASTRLRPSSVARGNYSDTWTEGSIGSTANYHSERNHQGKGNRILFPDPREKRSPQHHAIECCQRLGGLLKYYRRAA